MNFTAIIHTYEEPQSELGFESLNSNGLTMLGNLHRNQKERNLLRAGHLLCNCT